ncbi:MAG: T9SS type A sorting domain-containing protein [Bacteroidales bacterium]|nr:T9SS type A sorting domain-containing protein [Bacteroidales bacterium]
MKKKLIWMMVMCLSCLAAPIHAQTKVTISFYSAADQTLTVSDAGKLYFQDNYLYINEGSGVPYSFLLSAISKITFAEETGIEDIETSEVCIYPNPASDIFRIHNNRAERSQYSLYSSDGRLLQSGVCQNDEPIDVQRYAKGLYLLQVDGVTFKISKL